MAPLTDIAKRAHVAYTGEPGFIGCYVESEQPAVLAYDFDSNDHAVEFQFRLEVQQTPFRMKIPSDRPSTVLEYR